MRQSSSKAGNKARSVWPWRCVATATALTSSHYGWLASLRTPCVSRTSTSRHLGAYTGTMRPHGWHRSSSWSGSGHLISMFPTGRSSWSWITSAGTLRWRRFRITSASGTRPFSTFLGTWPRRFNRVMPASSATSRPTTVVASTVLFSSALRTRCRSRRRLTFWGPSSLPSPRGIMKSNQYHFR